MAPIVAAVSAIAASASAGLAALGTFLGSSSFLLRIGLSLVSMLLQSVFAPKPKAPNLGSQNLTRTVRQPITHRRRIYGRRRLGGSIVYAETTSDDTLLHLVIVVAAHEIDGFEEVYFDDAPIWTTSGGVVSDYADFVRLKFYTGTDDQVADPDLVADSGGFPGSGKGALAAPASVAFTVGPRTATDGGSVSSMHITWPAVAGAARYRVEWRNAEGEWSAQTTSDPQYYTEDFQATVGLRAARVSVKDGDGKWSRWRYDDGELSSATAAWTTAHRLRGLAYIYARLKYDADKFPNGIPNITAIARGAKVYDPRDASTAWTSNPALCIRDYLLDADVGLGCAAGEIDEASFIAAANAAEEQIEIAAGVTENRFELHGVVDSDISPERVLETMLLTMGGSLGYSGGVFALAGYVHSAPVMALTTDDIVGPISVRAQLSASERMNAVKGVFPSRDHLYVQTDYPPQESTTYAAEDGRAISRDLDLDMVTKASHAQRIAKVALLRSRQQITVNLPIGIRGMQLKPGSIITLTIDRYGWATKEFEVLEWSFQVQSSGELGIALSLREIGAAVFDWTVSEEQTMTAGLPTRLIADDVVLMPGQPTITATATENTGGEVVAGARFDWTASPNAGVVSYEIQWTADRATYAGSSTAGLSYDQTAMPADLILGARVRAVLSSGRRSAWSYSDPTAANAEAVAAPTGLAVGTYSTGDEIRADASWDAGTATQWVVDYREAAGAWVRFGTVTSPAASITLTGTEQDGHEVRVAAIDSAAAVSSWAALAFSIAADAVAPPPVSGFLATIDGTRAILTWTSGPVWVDAYRIRYSTKTVGATWAEAFDIVARTADTSANVPALAGTYLIKPISDFAGESETATQLTISSVSLQSLNVVETITSAPGWAGTQTNTEIETGGLVLTAGQSAGTYVSPVIDLGEEFPVRVAATIEAEGRESALMSTWTSLAAVSGLEALRDDGWSVSAEIRSYSDGAWTAWRSEVAGDHVGSQFQLRLSLSSTVVGFSPRVTRFDATLDMPDRVAGETDISCPIGGVDVTYSPAFRARPAWAVDGQSLPSGARKVVSGATATGFRVEFFDSGGASIAASFDWVAKGYGSVTG